METKTVDTQLTRRRLAVLKLRLEQVATAWTVDDYKSLVAFYVRILPGVLAAERCTIYIIEMGTDRICSMVGTGLAEKRIEPPRQGSIVGEVISSGRGIIVNDLDRRAGFHRQIATETGFVSRNMVCSPIKSVTTHGVTGAVQILNKQGQQPFLAQDLALLEEMASFLSMSIESIILNQEILRISNQLNLEVEHFDRGYFLDQLFIAESPAMREVLELVRLVCASPVNVLIQGDNGTGKELIARLIHESSNRREQPFVAVNCAAIPENLMESEFFGYEKGAFTGADRSHRGRFEEANNGTLLLDEIGDMPLTIQPKFLRAIQEEEGCRLGSNRLIPYNLRIISATNKDLTREVEQGRFRQDLYFRLFSVKIAIPPLRERKEDIVPLAVAFLEEVCKRFDKRVAGFSAATLNLFEDYDWPGNVRQLRSEVERLVALTPSRELILPDKCSRELQPAGRDNDPAAAVDYRLPERVRGLEIKLIREALRKTGANRQQAAELLGITRQGLHKKLKRYLIDPAAP